MSGSDTLGSSNQGVPGVYGTLGTPNGTANFPGGRWGAPNWIDLSGNLWLFGGYGFAGNATATFGYLNDLWEFNPSNNEWTWMGGAPTLGGNSCAEAPTYGTLGSFAPGNLPGGRQSAASWTDKNGNFWMFGGLGAGSGAPGSGGACGGAYNFGRLNDLWEFKPSLGAFGEWAWMSGSNTTPSFSGPPGSYGTLGAYSPSNVPGGRQNASTWIDSSGNFWLFGGEGYDSGGNFGELNDLWEFSPSVGTNGEWRWMGGSSTVPQYSGNPGVFTEPGQYPGSRYGAATWTDSSGNFWLFGGEGFDGAGNGGNLNDLWEFNPSTNIWAWISGSAVISNGGQLGMYGTLGTPNGTANFPGGRYEAASWIDSSGNLWLSGGQGDGAASTGMLNDLWAFNPPTDQWVWMGGSGTPFLSGVYGTLQSPANTNLPGGRNQTASWTDIDGNLWLFGGDGRANNVNYVGALNDLWVYPPPSICWGPPSAIQISPATLLAGFPGESYFQNFTGTGGCGTGYVWSITSGAAALTNLGLSFSSGGDLSGYPNAPGSYPFTVQVTDPRGNTGSQNYTLTIYPDITVLPASLPAGTVGTSYSQMLTGGGGAGGPYSFSVASGTALSAVGLTLSPAGLIAGTPSATETAAALKVQVADSQGDFTQVNYTLTINSVSSGPITINDPETVTVNDSATQVQLVDVSDPETITVTDIATVTVSGGQTTPPITWATPAAITYGTALSGIQLDAISTVPGTFVYAPAAGTVLRAGIQTLSVTFTPNDTTDYTSATAVVQLAVNKATPPITWATPSPIIYPTALSATQLDATSTVPGTFAYAPAAGTVLSGGTHVLSATFTPNDTTDYASATVVVQLTVNRATPPITWATPSPIIYPTALSATQLDATSTVPGTFAYTPAAGTVFSAGTQTLSVTFTPNDTTDYTTATATVQLTIDNPAPVISSLSPAIASAGGGTFMLTVNGSGFIANSILYWGTTAMTTTGSATQLTVQIPAADVASAGIYNITVQNPAPGGGTSNAFQFEVDSAGSETTTITTVKATVTPGATATYPVTLPAGATFVSVTCLNLPSGATCSYSSATNSLMITTSSTTPAGTYQIIAVFTLTEPGPATGFILLPFLLLPLVFMRRKLAARGVWVTACLVLILLAGAVATSVGCGGGQTHQATSSGVVTLIVQ